MKLGCLLNDLAEMEGPPNFLKTYLRTLNFLAREQLQISNSYYSRGSGASVTLAHLANASGMPSLGTQKIGSGLR